MKLFSLILREILGLFIDDELLALGILAVVAASALVAVWSPTLAGAILSGLASRRHIEHRQDRPKAITAGSKPRLQNRAKKPKPWQADKRPAPRIRTDVLTPF